MVSLISRHICIIIGGVIQHIIEEYLLERRGFFGLYLCRVT